MSHSSQRRWGAGSRSWHGCWLCDAEMGPEPGAPSRQPIRRRRWTMGQHQTHPGPPWVPIPEPRKPGNAQTVAPPTPATLPGLVGGSDPPPHPHTHYPVGQPQHRLPGVSTASHTRLVTAQRVFRGYRGWGGPGAGQRGRSRPLFQAARGSAGIAAARLTRK